MKTIDQIRYENLVKLIDEVGGGDLTRMLEKSKSWSLKDSDNRLSRPTIDQILKRRTTSNGAIKNVGDDLARKIEEEFRLERGWMDNDQAREIGSGSDAISPNDIADIVATYCRADDTGRRNIMTAVEIAKRLSRSIPLAVDDQLKGRS